jgi:hypothetical protein
MRLLQVYNLSFILGEPCLSKPTNYTSGFGHRALQIRAVEPTVAARDIKVIEAFKEALVLRASVETWVAQALPVRLERQVEMA